MAQVNFLAAGCGQGGLYCLERQGIKHSLGDRLVGVKLPLEIRRIDPAAGIHPHLFSQRPRQSSCQLAGHLGEAGLGLDLLVPLAGHHVAGRTVLGSVGIDLVLLAYVQQLAEQVVVLTGILGEAGDELFKGRGISAMGNFDTGLGTAGILFFRQ